MKYLPYVVMAVAIVGIIFGSKKKKEGIPWGEHLMLLSAVIAILCAGIAMLPSLFPGRANKRLIEIQQDYMRVSGQKLGQYLAATYPGANALVIVNPQMTMGPEGQVAPNAPNYLVDGLKKGLDNKITIVAEVAPKMPQMPGMPGMPGMPPAPPPPEGGEAAPAGGPPPEQMMMMMGPIEYWLNAKAYDEMLAPYIGKVDMIITTISLPMDAQNMKLWTLKPQPKLVLAGSMGMAGGNVIDLKKAVQLKAITAVLTPNPKGQYDEKKPPKNLDEAFNKRYLLITPENVEQIATDIPELFPPVAPPPTN